MTAQPQRPDDEPWLATVARDVDGLGRSSTAERIADVLRRRIIDGDLPPGTRMSEGRLGTVLRVSRNTLREAFRLLSHEGLLVHQLHRGVFVTELTEDDLRDLYQLRRTLQCGVLRSLSDVPDAALRELRDDLAAAESAAAHGDWTHVGTANMRFHEHLVGLAGNRRMDELSRRLLAELRLAFHVAASHQVLHEAYVPRNRELFELVAAGRYDQAADQLDVYLRQSESELLAAHAHRHRGSTA